MLERTHEHVHFGHETAQARQPEGRQTGNHIAHSEERHDFHQAAHLADVAGMGPSVNHPDQGKEKRRHQAVRKHLHDSPRHGCGVHHQQSEEHQAAMAYRRVGVDILEVFLHASRKCPVNHADTRQNQENPSQLVGRFGHQEHRYAEAAVAPQLHQNPGMEHRDRGRCRSVTVRAPCVEREEGA